MAVVSVKTSHMGWSGSADIKEGYSFNVTYLVEVDDPQDGAYEVISSPKMPSIGDAYEVGNDEYRLTALANLSASPVSGSRNLWEVQGTYKRIKPEEEDEPEKIKKKKKKDPKPEDPPDWPVIVSMTTNRVSRAASHGVYMGQYRYPKDANQNQKPMLMNNNDGAFDLLHNLPVPQQHTEFDPVTLQLLNGRPITNSAFHPFDPAPEMDYSREVLTIQYQSLNFPGLLMGAVNLVNNGDFFMKHVIEAEDPDGGERKLTTGLVIKKGTAKIQSVKSTPTQVGAVGFFAVEVEIEIDRLFGWRYDILDRGYMEKDERKEPNGSYPDPAKTKVITDKSGNPVKEPVLLDGHGVQLKVKDMSAVYLQYALYPEIDFTVLNIHDPEKMKKLK